MPDAPPTGPADHAEDIAHRYAEDLDRYCVTRSSDLGSPENKNG